VAIIWKNSSMENYITYFNQNYPSNNLEEVLLGLREMGATQMETLRVLKSELKLTIPEADEIVLNSETWKDMKEANIQLRDEIDVFFESLKG
jgi:uncharacterized protein YdhG (YjbR/CyaY superfamily)